MWNTLAILLAGSLSLVYPDRWTCGKTVVCGMLSDRQIPEEQSSDFGTSMLQSPVLTKVGAQRRCVPGALPARSEQTWEAVKVKRTGEPAPTKPPVGVDQAPTQPDQKPSATQPVARLTVKSIVKNVQHALLQPGYIEVLVVDERKDVNIHERTVSEFACAKGQYVSLRVLGDGDKPAYDLRVRPEKGRVSVHECNYVDACEERYSVPLTQFLDIKVWEPRCREGNCAIAGLFRSWVDPEPWFLQLIDAWLSSGELMKDLQQVEDANGVHDCYVIMEVRRSLRNGKPFVKVFHWYVDVRTSLPVKRDEKVTYDGVPIAEKAETWTYTKVGANPPEGKFEVTK